MNTSFAWEALQESQEHTGCVLIEKKTRGKEEIELVGVPRTTGPYPGGGCRNSGFPDKVREGEVLMKESSILC